MNSYNPADQTVTATQGQATRAIPLRLLAEHGGNMNAAWDAYPDDVRRREWREQDAASRMADAAHRMRWEAATIAKFQAEGLL